ncbi:hypothetical protein B0H13DRAFT_2686689 [Mycena leptocephala]|nr:hypothetical protein B0H13DRAFT_2686689 [Mycena leptocephala]
MGMGVGYARIFISTVKAGMDVDRDERGERDEDGGGDRDGGARRWKMKGKVLRVQLEMEIEEVYTDWHSLIGADSRSPVRARVHPPLPSLALAFGPVLVVVEHGYFGFSLESPRYCMHPHSRASSQGTCARARSVDVEAGAAFLAAYALPFLVERGLRMQRNACVHAHRDPDMTLGADVRARASVEVGMGMRSAGLGARTSSPRGCGVCTCTPTPV